MTDLDPSFRWDDKGERLPHRNAGRNDSVMRRLLPFLEGGALVVIVDILFEPAL